MSGQFPMYPGTYNQDDQQPSAYGMNVPQPQPMNLNGRSQLLPNIMQQSNNGMSDDLPQYAQGGQVGQMPQQQMSPIYPNRQMQQMRPMQPMPQQGYNNYNNSMFQPIYRNNPGQMPQMADEDQMQDDFNGPMNKIPYHNRPRMMKKGGLASLAKKVRKAGTDGDTILAHINPLEAAQLAAQSGGASINPRTGLPSYKFKIGKVLKTVARVAAPFVGGAIAGPVGAAIGGGLAGLAGSGDSTGTKVLKGLGGAGLGYAGAGGFGDLGGAGAIIPTVNDTIGLTGIANNLNMDNLGAGAAKAAGPIGAASAVSNAIADKKAAAAEPTGLGKFFDKLDANTLVPLGLAGVGLAMGPKKEYPNEGNVGDLEKYKPDWGPDQQYRKMKPLKRALRDLKAEDYLQPGAPELEYFEDSNPQAEPMASGGLVHYMANGGYLDGETGGQDDHIDAKLSDGEYVLSADIVSSLGDGNNNAGAKKLDAFMKNVRAHKTSKGSKGLPPKAKSLNAYMSKRGAK